MTKLFYIDHLDYDLEKLNLYIGDKNNCRIIIFTPYEVFKLKWKSQYPVYSYSDLKIDASLGVFEDLLKDSYIISEKVTNTVSKLSSLSKEQKELTLCLTGKIHRVICECMKSERVVNMMLNEFKPNKIYLLSKAKELFSETINTLTNYEYLILENISKTSDLELEYLEQDLQIEQTKYKKSLLKNRIKRHLNTIKHYKNLFMASPVVNKNYTVMLYMHAYYYKRFIELFKFANNDTSEKYFILATGFSINEQKDLIKQYPNLSFSFVHDNYPTVKNNSQTFDLNMFIDCLTVINDNRLKNSYSIISMFLIHFIDGYYHEYIQNNKVMYKLIQKLDFKKAIFLSFWDVQQAIFLRECNRRGIKTTSLQTGFSYPFAGEKTFALRHAVYGEREKLNIKTLFSLNNEILTLGWLQKSYYNNIEKEFIKSDKQRILFLFSMSGAWQNFVYFPEELIIMDILKLANKYPDKEFVLRTRVGDDLRKYLELDEFKSLKNVILDTQSLEERFSNVDMVFTQSTTAGFEAIAFGLPVFYLALHALNDSYPLYDLDEQYIAYDTTSMENLIISFNDEKFLLEYMQNLKKVYMETFSLDVNYPTLLA